MSAFDEAYAQIGNAIVGGPPGARDPDPGARLEGVLGDYLGALASDPVSARVFLIEVYAAGPEALRRRHELQQRLTDAIVELVGASDAEDRFAVEAFLGAIVSVVTTRLAVGDAASLPNLREPLMALARRLGLLGGPAAARG